MGVLGRLEGGPCGLDMGGRAGGDGRQWEVGVGGEGIVQEGDRKLALVCQWVTVPLPGRG